jgi:hypothetical protein
LCGTVAAPLIQAGELELSRYAPLAGRGVEPGQRLSGVLGYALARQIEFTQLLLRLGIATRGLRMDSFGSGGEPALGCGGILTDPVARVVEPREGELGLDVARFGRDPVLLRRARRVWLD